MLTKSYNRGLVYRVHSILKTTATVVKFTAGAIAHGIMALVKFTAEIIPEIVVGLLSQLDTCMAAGVRYVVLSAFGCGAFQNPSPIVAETYKQEVRKRIEHFDVVAFAIFHAGYGPDNFGVFRDIFEGA
jgi:uncharacterized protein (TIGR02452 family)